MIHLLPSRMPAMKSNFYNLSALFDNRGSLQGAFREPTDQTMQVWLHASCKLQFLIVQSVYGMYADIWP